METTSSKPTWFWAVKRKLFRDNEKKKNNRHSRARIINRVSDSSSGRESAVSGAVRDCRDVVGHTEMIQQLFILFKEIEI